MSVLTIIFIAIIICAEIDFFAVMFCKEISEWLKAKSEEIRARAETIRENHKHCEHCRNETDRANDSEPDTEIFRREGSE